MTENTVIQWVKTSPFTCDIVIFNQRVVSNLANFCCADDINFKSISVGTLHSIYATHHLINKTTGKSPVMFQPVVFCHEKDEKAVKLLCDSRFDVSPDLAENLRILCVDWGNSILNQTCNAFLFAT